MQGQDIEDYLEQFMKTYDFSELFKYGLELSRQEKPNELKPRYDTPLFMRIMFDYITVLEGRCKKGIPTTEHNLRIVWTDAIHSRFVTDKVMLMRTFVRIRKMYVLHAKPSERMTEEQLDLLLAKMLEAFVRSYQQIDLCLDQMVDLMGRDNQWKGLIPITNDRAPLDYIRQFNQSRERGEFETWWDSEENET